MASFGHTSNYNNKLVFELSFNFKDILQNPALQIR